MLQLPPRFATVILSFAPLFFQRSWRHAEVLLLGAILTLGRARWPACCGSPAWRKNGIS